MGNGKVPHRRRRHLQQQGGQQAQDALVADDQQMVKMAAVGQRWDKLADAAGKILKAFAVGGGRMLPVGTPGGIVFRIFSLEVAMMTHLPVAEKHLIERGMALTRNSAVAKQQIGRCPGPRQLATEYFIERRQAQSFAERARLSDAARRQGVGAWPLYNPATLASVSPWRTNHNFMNRL